MSEKLSKRLKLTQLALLVIYIYIILYITLFTRTPGEEMRCRLQLFWSYRALLFKPGNMLFRQIVLNIMLFMPFGFLLFRFIRGSRPKFILVVVSFGLSAFIELSQFFFKVGMFEFDDIFNNTLGAIIGAGVYYSLVRFVDKSELRGVFVGLMPLVFVTLFFSGVLLIKL